MFTITDTMAPLRPGETLLTVDEAKAVLADAVLRQVDNRITVWYAGRWRRLVRTDWKDDVRTHTCLNLTNGDVLARFLAAVRYGARVGPDVFAVIDSYSDG